MSPALPLDPAGTGLAVIGLAGALGVGLVFVQAGLAKLRHRELLPGVIANYRLLPAPFVTPAAQLLPFAELAIGAALLGGGQRIAILPAVALLAIFAVAMAVNIGRGRRHIDCGCGRSQLRQPLSWLLVGRNIALALALLPRLLPAPLPGGMALATAIAGGAAIFLLFLLFNAVAALNASPLGVRR